MKIAMIGQKGIPVQSGGVERHVEEISRRLVERGHSVTVYNRKGYVDLKDDKYLGINLRTSYTIKSKGLEAVIYSFFASVDSLFRGYDIIHYHALGPATMTFLPKIFGKKVVVTIHGLDWQRNKWGKFGKSYLKLGEKASALFPDRIITVSNKLKNYYMQKYNKQAVFIPNGIMKPEIREANIIKKYGLEKNNYILFLARLVPEKGCHYLLEAFSGINTNVKLVIAGGGSYTDDYCGKLYEYKKENIIFTGEVKGELLDELYSNALFYVLPSEIEGMPISLLEAMSYGVCPLVSDIEENMEVLAKGGSSFGFSFLSKNVDSLREKILYMLDNKKDVLSIGQAAKDYVLEDFNWDRVTDGLENEYKALMA